ncbi:MAG: hypothetical protein KBD00_03180 [Candidatus Peribacteraceae bacterium]|nr:hypothetical protein [Candidatus Peribacteraceae bacterium]
MFKHTSLQASKESRLVTKALLPWNAGRTPGSSANTPQAGTKITTKPAHQAETPRVEVHPSPSTLAARKAKSWQKLKSICKSLLMILFSLIGLTVAIIGLAYVIEKTSFESTDTTTSSTSSVTNSAVSSVPAPASSAPAVIHKAAGTTSSKKAASSSKASVVSSSASVATPTATRSSVSSIESQLPSNRSEERKLLKAVQDARRAHRENAGVSAGIEQ